MRIAITGENGFLGYHLKQYYKWIKGYTIISLGRDYIKNINLLKECDLLIHCAGVNRGENVYEKNIEITKKLVDEMEKNKIKINIKFMSSTQINLNNEYGKSKIVSNEILKKYSLENKTKLETYHLPNLFGPFGKPNYNSFISTFCYNIVNNLECNYNKNEISICYVYDAIEVIDNKCDNYKLIKTTVEDVFKKINYFHKKYITGIIPKITKDNEFDFDLKLFNTYRSFSQNIFNFEKYIDDRGSLVELVKGEGSETQVFFSVTKPNITRGNHFHFNKVERFCVLLGNALIKIKKNETDEIIEFLIKEGDNKVVDIPILHTHNITNIGNEDLICVFWVNEIFDKNNPDTYANNI